MKRPLCAGVAATLVASGTEVNRRASGNRRIIAARYAPWPAPPPAATHHQQLPRAGGDAQLGADGEAQLFQP
ncbi:hypothetical protein OZ13_19360 [Xanthomonas cannabis pv. cannabis]|nr:hypothetical protein OZ13_19360 [Xanthomonas cannabis pv. cannabis]KHL54565.1 hypothetical protein OZ10_12850 [Xanthomonas cannabis pv. cannabis]